MVHQINYDPALYDSITPKKIIEDTDPYTQETVYRKYYSNDDQVGTKIDEEPRCLREVMASLVINGTCPEGYEQIDSRFIPVYRGTTCSEDVQKILYGSGSLAGIGAMTLLATPRTSEDLCIAGSALLATIIGFVGVFGALGYTGICHLLYPEKNSVFYEELKVCLAKEDLDIAPQNILEL